MRKIIIGWGCLAVTVVGCSLFSNKNAKTVLDVATIGCIIANATSPDETVQKVCGIVSELTPAMKEVLKAHRDEAAKYASLKCH